MQIDVDPFCALQASVSYETGGREGVSGTLWTIRACVYLPSSPTPLHQSAPAGDERPWADFAVHLSEGLQEGVMVKW